MKKWAMSFCLLFSTHLFAGQCLKFAHFEKTSECSFKHKIRIDVSGIQNFATLYGKYLVRVNGQNHTITLPEITMGPGNKDYDSGYRYATLNRPTIVSQGVYLATFRILCDGSNRDSVLRTEKETTFSGCDIVSECDDTDSGGDSGGSSGGSGGNCAEFP